MYSSVFAPSEVVSVSVLFVCSFMALELGANCISFRLGGLFDTVTTSVQRTGKQSCLRKENDRAENRRKSQCRL